MDNIKLLQKKLSNLEKQLEKVRGASPLSDGWQTQRLAKKQRKWDELAKQKTEIQAQIDELCWDKYAENTRKNMSCIGCGALFNEECCCN